MAEVGLVRFAQGALQVDKRTGQRGRAHGCPSTTQGMKRWLNGLLGTDTHARCSATQEMQALLLGLATNIYRPVFGYICGVFSC